MTENQWKSMGVNTWSSLHIAKQECVCVCVCLWTPLGRLKPLVSLDVSVCTCHCLEFLEVKYWRSQIPVRQSGFEDCSQWLQADILCDIFIGAPSPLISLHHRFKL
ncbi:hypothetical protein GOODEAATRI_031881 [Goodea atripinnis]|uniref:Uncharacterized protein n=1 Tax=Goodea atripinnis TaxID=208336 RepID=A0ABV0MWU6_9TELE